MFRPIARKENLIGVRSAAFFTVLYSIWFTPTDFTQNSLINTFKNLTIPRLIVNLHILQVSRTFKTSKAIKFCPQILCLQVSVLVIHWHCFQVSYASAQL